MSKIDDLKNQVNIINKQITLIQEECSHPKTCLTKDHRSNTGNFDPHDDHYWTDMCCNLCDKRWTVKGSVV